LFATKLGHKQFKATAGWFSYWKIKLGITSLFVKYVVKTLQIINQYSDWLIKYLPIINQCSSDDVYNVDKTGLFYKCLPSQTFVLKGEREFRRGKNSKEKGYNSFSIKYDWHR